MTLVPRCVIDPLDVKRLAAHYVHSWRHDEIRALGLGNTREAELCRAKGAAIEHFAALLIDTTCHPPVPLAKGVCQ